MGVYITRACFRDGTAKLSHDFPVHNDVPTEAYNCFRRHVEVFILLLACFAVV